MKNNKITMDDFYKMVGKTEKGIKNGSLSTSAARASRTQAKLKERYPQKQGAKLLQGRICA